MNQHAEHIAHSAPCASRWDGFDRGDDFSRDDRDQGQRVVGRMTRGDGKRVEIIEAWSDDLSFFEVAFDGNRVHTADDRESAVTVARWWMAGCPA